MSRPDLINNNEEKGVGEGDVREGLSGSSRRRFIRNMAIGTAGAAFAISNLDRLQGATRLLARLTKSHVEGFIDHIKDAKGSPQARKEFQRLSKMILDTVDGDPECRDTFNAIKHYLSHPVVPIPRDAKHSDVGMLLGAGYLRALTGIEETNRHVTADDIKKRLQNPKNILHVFETGFLNELYAKTKEESESNPNFARSLVEADSELKQVVALNKEARLIPASFQCPDCTITWPDGSQYCASWEECVGLVIVIVVIFAILK